MTTPTPLSIVVPTTRPWPALRGCLTRLRVQGEGSATDLIVVDGTTPPETGLPHDERAGLRWLSCPGASVFALRAAGLAAARGTLVAFTEDHCLPRADWCARLGALAAAYPAADAIGGAVVNGSTARLIDCANFALTFASFLPPLGRAPTGRAPTVANVAYHRRVLPAEAPAPGWLEFTLNERLLADKRVVFDDALVVEHVQSHGFLGTLAAHFHNGRATTGLVAPALDRTARRHRARHRVARLPRLLSETLAALDAKGIPAGHRRAYAPLLAVLVACHGLGELVGLIAGPGRSPARLR